MKRTTPFIAPRKLSDVQNDPIIIDDSTESTEEQVPNINFKSSEALTISKKDINHDELYDDIKDIYDKENLDDVMDWEDFKEEDFMLQDCDSEFGDISMDDSNDNIW